MWIHPHRSIFFDAPFANLHFQALFVAITEPIRKIVCGDGGIDAVPATFRVSCWQFLPFLESAPDVSAKLKAPVTADRKFEDVVKSAQDAAVLVLVY